MSDFIQKIFGKRKEPGLEETPLSPAGAPPPASPEMLLPSYEPPQILAGIGHSVGRQREHNEDALFTLTTTLVTEEQASPFGIYIVADGMGGHLHGERASGVAVRTLAGHLIEGLYSPLIANPASEPKQEVQQILQVGVEKANHAILSQAPGGGTTLTAAVVWENQLTIVHVGDSRAYAVSRDGSIHTLTHDHSLVSRLVELGQISSDEAAAHPQRNVLYRALGQGEPVEAEFTSLPFDTASHLLICSDGLWGSVSETEISRLILSSSLPAEACQGLVDAANTAGGPDNISVILIRLPN